MLCIYHIYENKCEIKSNMMNPIGSLQDATFVSDKVRERHFQDKNSRCSPVFHRSGILQLKVCKFPNLCLEGLLRFKQSPQQSPQRDYWEGRTGNINSCLVLLLFKCLVKKESCTPFLSGSEPEPMEINGKTLNHFSGLWIGCLTSRFL